MSIEIPTLLYKTVQELDLILQNWATEESLLNTSCIKDSIDLYNPKIILFKGIDKSDSSGKFDIEFTIAAISINKKVPAIWCCKLLMLDEKVSKLSQEEIICHYTCKPQTFCTVPVKFANQVINLFLQTSPNKLFLL